MGRRTFEKLFPVILTDNGSEFSNPKSIEFGPEQKDIRRTNIFYCDPSSPYQKGAIEVNHELIRRIIPKGFSLDELTQKDISLMMNHINSYKRKKLNNRTPYEAFSFYYVEEVLNKFGCIPIAPEFCDAKIYVLNILYHITLKNGVLLRCIKYLLAKC